MRQPRRAAGRVATLLALAGVIGGTGCGAPGSESHGGAGHEPRDRVQAVAARPFHRRLSSPDGPASSVVALAWGGSPTAPLLAVGYTDGRFAVYGPDRGSLPVSAGPDRPDTPARALAVVAPGRIVTGDVAGLTLWDVGVPRARPIVRRPCGPVGALAVGPGGDGDLLAGLADGRILRFRTRGDGPLGLPVAESRTTAPGAGVVALLWSGEGRDVVALRANGRASRFHHDLLEVPEDLGLAAAAAVTTGPPRLARVVDGPALAIGDPRGPGPLRRFCLPGPASGLAFLRGGAELIVACDGQLLRLDPRGDGPGRYAEVRVLDAPRGPTAVAADPSGRRLARGDATGMVEVLDLDALDRDGRLWSYDEVAGLAFQPGRRLHRPRPGAPGLDLPEALKDRIEAARAQLDRGEAASLLGELRQLDAAPALDRAGAAEVAVLTAAARQAGGWPTPAVLKTLEGARDSFGLLGRADREADVRFWQGMLLAPPLEGSGGSGAAARRTEEALAQFRRAAALYRSSRASLERPARLCEAMQAWALLGLGDLHGAIAAFRPVAASARADPVLGQAPELERIAAALAAARDDWAVAAEADVRLLQGLAPGDRPGLRREATLARLGALAALGRWADAAHLVEADVPDDPTWHLRRSTVRSRAGLPVSSPPQWPEDDLREAHVRGLLAAAEARRLGSGLKAPALLETACAALAQAAEFHRRGGRDELAAEADLGRAEALERLRRCDEALMLYEGLARQLGSGPADDRTGLAVRPIRAAGARLYRGIARCQLALGRPAPALTALDRAALVPWFARDGEAAVRTADLVVPPEGRSLALELRDARLEAEGLRGRAEIPTGDDAAARVRRLEAALAASHQRLSLAGPTPAFDPSSLHLADDEAVLIVAAVGPEALVGFVVRGEHSPEAQILPTTRSELRRAVRAWRSSLGDGGRGLAGAEPGGLDGLLGLAPEPDPVVEVSPRLWDGARPEVFLDDVLIHPFEASLLGVKRLTVVPDDALGALPLERIGRDRPLRQRFGVSYAPTISVLQLLRGRVREPATHGRDVLILQTSDIGEGPDELLALSAPYRSAGLSPRLVAGEEARPSRLLGEAIADVGVIHSASAATLVPSRSPWGDVDLRLAPGDPLPRDDGRLTAGDLLRVPLRARVVTLAVGRPQDRDAVTGPGLRDLARGWLAAGAAAVVLSLWDPPAASRVRFLAEFHRAVADGESPSRALDRARDAVARDPQFRDPVHWAGFVLYGTP
jgi:tetratricopeptide (TPR) repeat protein